MLGGVPLEQFVFVAATPQEQVAIDVLRPLGVESFPLGVGKVAATAELYSFLPQLEQRRRVAAVLLYGIAGAYPDRHRNGPAPVRPGDVCIVGSDVLADEGVVTEQGFRSITKLGFGDVGPFPAAPKLVAEAAARLGVQVVRGATVSTCSGSEASSSTLVRRHHVDVESMEGAAVAYVCRRRELPLLQLRAISNWTGDRERGEWNIGAAITALERALRRLWAPDVG